MQVTRTAGLILVSLIGSAAGAQSPTAFKPFEFLVGSCWQGAFPDGKKTDRHCYEWVYDKKFIRDRHIVPGDKPYEGETIYHADPKTGKISYTYWSNEGLVITGSAEESAGSLVFPSRYSTPQGEVELKAVWTRTGPDSYRVTNSRKTGDAWAEMWTMELKRIAKP